MGVSEMKEMVPDNSLTDEERGEGWMLLFNGIETEVWRAYLGDSFPDNWIVENGALKCLGGDVDLIFYPVEFAEFEISFTWKIQSGGNSGLLYHIVEREDLPATYYSGPEYQIVDQLGFDTELEPLQSLAGDYGMYAPILEEGVKKAGEWNESRIVYKNSNVSYWLNGKRTVEFIPDSQDWLERRDSGKWKDFPQYAKTKKGYIGLQAHGDPVWYKNIKIRML
ncbi:3-keto-disaccharide hydrolase [Belliella buryatensis]|uniref:3-keto-disaccharide hydrolase n=1 Tax=Belliella buryatensis TaxID=1500549 RepID=UPI001FE2DCFE|nr:DUF1080 domain-containing protein [Belliella buryatensis]